MKYNINIRDSIKYDNIEDFVNFNILGSYSLRNEEGRFSAKKKNSPVNINYGRFSKKEFDSFNARKAAYKLTKDKILNMFRGTKSEPIKGEGIVKIYKKRKT